MELKHLSDQPLTEDRISKVVNSYHSIESRKTDFTYIKLYRDSFGYPRSAIVVALGKAGNNYVLVYCDKHKDAGSPSGKPGFWTTLDHHSEASYNDYLKYNNIGFYIDRKDSKYYIRYNKR